MRQFSEWFDRTILKVGRYNALPEVAQPIVIGLLVALPLVAVLVSCSGGDAREQEAHPAPVGTGISTILLCVATVEGTGQSVLEPRNCALASKLPSCPSRGVVGGEIRVGYTFGVNIVFDVRSRKGDAYLINY